MRKVLIPAFAVAVATLPAQAQHACPQDLEAWRQLLGAEWIDCHAVADLTTTNNPFTDPQSLTGMGFPPPGSGTLNSKYTAPTSPPVSGIQIDGYFPDACEDRKSTRLNSSHGYISYAVLCLKKKKNK